MVLVQKIDIEGLPANKSQDEKHNAAFSAYATLRMRILWADRYEDGTGAAIPLWHLDMRRALCLWTEGL